MPAVQPLALTRFRRPVGSSHTRQDWKAPVSSTDTSKEMTAEAYLARLGERGIEYVFANAGTDFAPIIEGISRNTGNAQVPALHHRAARERRDGDGARLLPHLPASRRR